MSNSQVLFGDLLITVEAELVELGRLAEQFQAVLGPAILRAADDFACHQEAQIIDLITQRLYGLSDFMRALRPSVPEVWSVDPEPAARVVTLSDLSCRLRGAPAQLSTHEAGEFEAF